MQSKLYNILPFKIKRSDSYIFSANFSPSEIFILGNPGFLKKDQPHPKTSKYF